MKSWSGNIALGLLLDGITESHSDVDGKFEWTAFHRRFGVSQLQDRDNEEKREKVMAAKVDGCLQTIEPGKARRTFRRFVHPRNEACPTKGQETSYCDAGGCRDGSLDFNGTRAWATAKLPIGRCGQR